MSRYWRRLSVRLKLTLISAAVMALVLTTIGLSFYFRLKSDLDSSILQALRSRAGALASVIEHSQRRALAQQHLRVIPRAEPFAQIVATDGRVLEGTRQAAASSLLSPAELRQAARGATYVDRGEKVRLYALPVRTGGRQFVAVVGASLEDREKALETLAAALLIGGPLLLLIASGIAYGVARGALRPVEAMREQAAGVSATQTGRRLPLPEARDEVHRLGETLNEMLARLEHALERERRFVADASHELRTPISILKAELELASDEALPASEVHAAARSAGEEADRLAQLAEDLLLIARSEQGRLPLRASSIDTSELFERLAARFAARSQNGRKILIDGAEQLIVDADPRRLEQALGNLIDNALRYGRGSVALQAKANEAEGLIELHVLDEGDGFSDVLLVHGGAFERFRRGADDRAGAGLGLAIAQAIARAHGGDAHVRNLPYGGADAWIALPRAAAPPVP
jgi:signal transduction histidine kinase